MRNEPGRIYLNFGLEDTEGEDFNACHRPEVTWCENKVDDGDVAYVNRKALWVLITDLEHEVLMMEGSWLLETREMRMKRLINKIKAL